MDDLAQRVALDFAPDGPLAVRMPGYVHREEQAQLAVEIAETAGSGGALLSEAETGIGKTLAYLATALRSDDKVLVSTHTRALQDQLVYRDIPAVRDALGVRREVVLLKGRANYLCPMRLERHLRDGRQSSYRLQRLREVEAWSDRSRDGDLSGLDFDPFDEGIGGMVTATADQCLGGKCSDHARCPLMRARAAAHRADVVVTNHSLMLADAALKRGDFGEVLPEFDLYVVDEAHALPELARQHFGLQITLRRLLAWSNDVQAALDELGDEVQLKGEITAHTRHLIEVYAGGDLAALAAAWRPLADLVGSRAERGDELRRLSDRAEAIAGEIEEVRHPGEGFVAWSEGRGEQIRHVLAPVETGPVLANHFWNREAAFALLSATLRLSGSFAHTREKLGLTEPRESYHPSPFDYRAQGLVYVPRHLPDSGRPDRGAAITDEIVRLLEASRGRAFVLFTAYTALRDIAPRLRDRLSWPVLEQGRSGSRESILHRFREDTHSILCATRSFWEGVDVPGETLSLVVIDKLPFAPPNDPLLAARIRACEEAGGHGFRDIQLPEAIAVLRQGVGRLIRTHGDRGVMAILDSRLYRKGYGGEVRRNLPPAPVTDDIDDVRAFFSSESVAEEA